MGGKPDQQQNPMDGILTGQQQTELASVKNAEDLKHFMEQKAMDALSAEQKAEVQKYWEEHDSPQALADAAKAQAENAKEDKALVGGVCAVLGAFTCTDLLADRIAGAQGLQGLAGNQGSTMVPSLGNTLMAILGLGTPAPAPNGAAPTTPQNNNQFNFT